MCFVNHNKYKLKFNYKKEIDKQIQKQVKLQQYVITTLANSSIIFLLIQKYYVNYRDQECILLVVSVYEIQFKIVYVLKFSTITDEVNKYKAQKLITMLCYYFCHHELLHLNTLTSKNKRNRYMKLLQILKGLFCYAKYRSFTFITSCCLMDNYIKLTTYVLQFLMVKFNNYINIF